MRNLCGFTRPAVAGVLIAASLAALAYSGTAEAHRRGGWFVGGLVVGAMLAPRYVSPAPIYHYAPPIYYQPQVIYSPPPMVYAPPPMVYATPPQVIYSPPPVTYAAPPVSPPQPTATAQSLSIEERLRRLRHLCDEGLLTAGECQLRREELLREL